jgi:hypothetical protein
MSDSDRNNLNEMERGERWLAAIPTPPPSADSIDRVKRAVRDELRRQSPVVHRRWSAPYGALAAAAAIALAVWVGWVATRKTPNAPLQIANAGNSGSQSRPIHVDDESVAPSDESVAMANDIEEKLTSLEDWSGDETWDLTGHSLSEAMDEIFSDPVKENQSRRGV